MDEEGPEGLGFPEGQRFSGVKSGCDLCSSYFAGPSGGDGGGDGGCCDIRIRLGSCTLCDV